MSAGGAEPLLYFALEGADYALRLRDVRGVGSCGALRPVPGAPPAVPGLAEWRGSVLTVVDLARLLGHSATGARPCLIRLGEPLRGVAFRLPAVVRVVDVATQQTAPVPMPAPLDPAALLRRLESEIGRGR